MGNSSWKRSEHECPGPLKAMENNFVLESVGPTQKSAPITHACHPAARRQPAAVRNSAPKTCPRIHRRPNRRIPLESHAPFGASARSDQAFPSGKVGMGVGKENAAHFPPLLCTKKGTIKDDPFFCGEQGTPWEPFRFCKYLGCMDIYFLSISASKNALARF